MRRLITTALLLSSLLTIPSQAARTFAGSTHIISAGSDTAVDLHSALTVCAWIYPVSATKNGRIVQHGDLATSPFIEWDLKLTGSGKLSLETQFGSPVGATTVATTTWQTACGVWSGTNAIVYLNGSADATLAASGTLTHTSHLTEIGNSSVFGGDDYQGRIAEVGIWNVADGAIVAQFNAGYSPKLIRRGNLRGYWPLNGWSPEIDLFSTFAGTVTGAFTEPHPRIIR